MFKANTIYQVYAFNNATFWCGKYIEEVDGENVLKLHIVTLGTEPEVFATVKDAVEKAFGFVAENVNVEHDAQGTTLLKIATGVDALMQSLQPAPEPVLPPA
jgi:hypothetical protein